MRSARADESSTEFAIRLVREEAQLKVLTELRDQFQKAAVAARAQGDLVPSDKDYWVGMAAAYEVAAAGIDVKRGALS